MSSKHLLFFLICTCHCICAQNSDEKYQELSVDSIISLSQNILYSDGDKLKQLSQLAIKRSGDSDDVNNSGRAHKLMGYYYAIHDNQFDSIEYYFLKSNELYYQAGDSIRATETNFTRAQVYNAAGTHTEALHIAFEALAFWERKGDQENIMQCYSLLGYIYQFTGDIEKAINYSNLALEYYREQENIDGINNVLTNLFYAYYDNGKFQEALDIAQQKLIMAKKMQQEHILGRSYIHLSTAFRSLGSYSEALAAARSAEQYAANMMQSNQMLIKTEVSSSLTELGRYQEAESIMLEIISYYDELPKDYNRQYAFQNIVDLYNKMGNAQKGFEYSLQYNILMDTFYNERIESLESELDIKYASAQKDDTIAEQESTISQQKKVQMLYLIIGFLLICGMLSLLYFFIKNKKRNRLLREQKAEIEKQNNQNALLLKEIHHRVKNNLEVVSSLLGLQSAKLDDVNAKEAMVESQNRVLSMGIIHQKLYQRDNLAAVEMKDYFINLGEGILDNFGMEQKIKIECLMEDLELDIDTAVPIGLIVNELLTNALKYAFPENRAGTIQLALKNLPDKRLELFVKDNGIGNFSDSQNAKKGFGSQLVSLLTAQLNGAMDLLVDNGTTYTFTFNKA